MKTSKIVIGSLALLLLLLSLSTAAVAPALKFTFKDVVAKGATQTDSYAITNAGTIAGDYVDSAGNQHGLVLAGKKVTKFDKSDCQTTGNTTGSIAAFGINKAGTVAGWCLSTKTGLAIGWTYAKGKFTNVVYPKASQTEPNGINDNGDVVGAYIDSAGTQHAFLLSKKKYTSFDPPGSTASTAWSINNAGLIAVYGIDSNGDYVSFTTKDHKTYKKFAYPKAGSVGTVIHGVNNKGDVTGTYFDSSSLAHGVLLHGGKYYSFDDPKASNSTRSDGINDKLVVVGRYSPADGTNHGFMATAK